MQQLSSRVTRIEESILALLLAAITIISFTQVIARYVFNSGWGGALELTRVLFAWMILFGMSYGIKMGSHLGVDAFVRLFPRPVFRASAIFGAICCILYAAILLKADWLQSLGASTKGGAVDYWQKMYKIGIGLDDLTYPDFIRELLGIKQERVHRWLAYIMLPLGLALFAFRSLEALIDIVRGKRETIIASHEAEELVAENRDALKD